ncbi:MAG: hypothetical protein COA80_10325 [Leeuwenhoekiella sp.]|nr:MAG: hypothetical protein COA80_10325 [Leeuwenhoekiella sp.]
MSNTGLIIEERARDIGDFLVGRLLPFRKKRMVGPFIFIDHMGPNQLGPDAYMDVDQHPHIGLSTLTYLIEGELMHEDSIGTYQRIKPGSVNWMVAGKGVVHTERTPKDMRDGNVFTMHGYQIWVALPKKLEHTEPAFHHIDAEVLPRWREITAEYKLIAGKGYGKTSPVPVHSDLFMIEIKAEEEHKLDIAGKLEGEIAVTLVSGEVEACGEIFTAGHMLVSKTDEVCKIKLLKGAHVFLFGGKPFEEERHIYWNFVATSKERIEEAKQQWKDREFPEVSGDDTYVPLPR